MNRFSRIASRIVESFLADRVARTFVGIDFPTQDALNQYRRDHDVRKNTKLKVLNRKAPPGGDKTGVKHTEEEKRHRCVGDLEKLGFDKEEVRSSLEGLRENVLSSIERMVKNGSIGKIVKRKRRPVGTLVSAVEGVATYVADRHSKINTDLRSGRRNRIADGIVKMIEFGPKNGVDNIFRGMSVDKRTFQKLGIKKGSVFSDAGFLSFSQDMRIASGFALYHHDSKDKIPVMFDVSGAKGHGLSISALGGLKQISNNHEVLLPPKVKFRVTDIRERDYKELRKMYPYKDFSPANYVDGDRYLVVKAVMQLPKQLAASVQSSGDVLFDDLTKEECRWQRDRLSEPMVLEVEK